MALGQALLRSSDVSTGFEGGFKYPLTLTAYLTAVYGAFFVAGSAFGVFEHAQAFQDYLFANREAIYLLAVLALNIISVLLIPAIFLAQRALNRRHRGWIAAGLAATNLLLLHFAHQPRPHVPFATIAFCATVLLVMAAHRVGGGWILLAASAASALTVGALQSGLLIIAPFLAAICLRPYQAGEYRWRELSSLSTLASLLLFAALCMALYPDLVGEYGAALAAYLGGSASEFHLGNQAHRFSLDMFSLANIPQFLERLHSYQPVLTLLFPVAAVYCLIAWRRRVKLLAVGLSFPLLNLAIWALYQGTFPRIMAVLLPFMILAAAYLLEDLLLALLPLTRARPRLWLIAAIAVLALPAGAAVRFVWLSAQTDTRKLASAWIEENLDDGEAILLNFQLTTLLPSTAAIERQSADFPASIGTQWQWLGRQSDVHAPRYGIFNRMYWQGLDNEADQAGFISANGIRYILARSVAALPTGDDMLAYARMNGRLLQVFCPAHDGGLAELPDDMFVQGWRQIWRLARPGPYVAIYDLHSPPLASEPAPFCVD